MGEMASVRVPRKLGTGDRNKGDGCDSGHSHGLTTCGAKGCWLVASDNLNFFPFPGKKGKNESCACGCDLI